MTESATVDVVAVGAHPDDCEIGCGGTLAALAQQGWRVAIIDLTDGEPTPLSDHPDVRLAEAREAAQVLGLTERVILELPNRRLFDTFEARLMLATELRRLRPKVVLGLAGRTPLASPDHWQALQITDAAVFYSRLSKWDGHFANLPPHKISHQLYYTLGFEAGEECRSPANAFVFDISATLAIKMQAARCYRSQFPTGKHYVFERVEAQARTWGAAAGFAAGERFFSARAVGLRDFELFRS
jgi:LmbE family N-acetylglucosaminyl deacetylase